MATVAWPSFPGRDLKIRVERLDQRDVFTSAGGKEVIRILWPSARYRITLTYSALRTGTPAPSPWASYSELAAVQYLVSRSNLGLDQLTYDLSTYDPSLGVTNVRVEQDGFAFERQNGAWWSCQVAFITQL
jgi:hypothetical protein